MKKLLLLISITITLLLSSCGSQSLNYRHNDGFGYDSNMPKSVSTLAISQQVN